MNNCKREKINKVIGVTEDGTVEAVQEYFEYQDGMRGYTGAHFVPVYQEQIDERNDVETVKGTYDTASMWREAVANEQTEKGLDEYTQELIDSDVEYGGRYFFAQDDSYVYEFEEQLRKIYPDAVTFECVGGGRMFGGKHQSKYKTLLEPELLQQILKVEGEAA